MATRCKRLHLTAVGKFEIVEGSIPETPKNGAIVKIAHAGVCHSDVHVSSKPQHPKFSYPRVLGHEISGTIYSMGEDVNKARPDLLTGSRVVVYPWGNCNKCNYCKNNLTSCSTMFLLTGAGPEGTYMYGVYQDGGYQEYMVVHEPKWLIPVPEGIPLDVAALVPCSGITSLSAVHSLRESVETALKVNGKAVVGLFGAGGLALWAVQIVKALYPKEVTVVAVDVNEEKLQDIKEQGADKVHQWGISDPVEKVFGDYMKNVQGQLDAAIDFTGIPSVQERVFALLNVHATMALVGLVGPKVPELLLSGVVLRSITIKGNFVGTMDHVNELFMLIKEGKVKAPPIREISLENVADTIQELKQGTARGRAVAKF